MARGFVFGKFLPFHEGHAAMIRFALGHCEAVTVLVCAGEHEEIPGQRRVAWIEETFADEPRVEVRCYTYRESELSSSSESSEEASEAWADVFLKVLPGHEVLVTSEPYGEMVARFMGIRHIPFDPPRDQHPISATDIRRNPFANWAFLPSAVRPWYAIRVALLGTESVGKTTLAAALAQHFHATWVPEAARDLIANSNSFTVEDLHRVVQAHADATLDACAGPHPLVFVDTDASTTAGYARHFFGLDFDLGRLDDECLRPHLRLYLSADVPHVQDGTRLPDDLRTTMDEVHRKLLAERGWACTEISGDWGMRLHQAIAAVNALLHSLRFQ
ncbi:MAG: AAA family ATPase [Bacteroidia bacterium]